MRGRGAQAKAAIDLRQLRAQLASYLYVSRPSALAAISLDDLQRRFSRLPAREVEYELTIARQKRSEELAAL